ncbi:DUF6520 family protein [Flavobacterium sp. IB48]|jgi:hypothetical protein|uniref:DUF6520 family protein n=1 Tax=Flavobacterium sp. IB48 TaxID=2779375 RepID=UPI0018E88869|nr:DUF6520 family protein [Flavobacterium sp. IB48]MBJ2126611.1 hypothetical protein [Flavobacterium sp. IB48]
MKTLSLKNLLPAGVIALAVCGAFATTSMQSASKKTTSLQQGYNALSNNKCGNVSVDCDNIQSDNFCHISGDSGPLAYEKTTNNNCLTPLYRYDN